MREELRETQRMLINKQTVCMCERSCVKHRALIIKQINMKVIVEPQTKNVSPTGRIAQQTPLMIVEESKQSRIPAFKYKT